MSRRLLTALALAVLTLTAQTPPNSYADAPQPPARNWEARRHPEMSLKDAPAPAVPSPQTETAAGPQVWSFDQWTRIAFQSYAYQNWEVELARPDGYQQRLRFTDDPGADLRPRLDRESKRVVWVSDRAGNYEIYSANTDGSHLRRLTDNTWTDDEPVWSPDGTRILFTASRDGDWDLYVMNADGSNTRQLTNLPGDEFSAVWSPDGKEIGFIYSEKDAAEGDILIAPAGGGAPRVFGRGLLYPARLVWSSDGTYFLCDAVDKTGWSSIVRVDPGGEATVLYAPGNSDAWMNAWAPGRADMIMVTRVFWTVINGVYYLRALQLNTVILPGGYATPLGGSGFDALADWQSTDLTPPQSRIHLLPDFSHELASVTWSASDGAGVGLERTEMKVEDLTTGEQLVITLDGVTRGVHPIGGEPGHTYRYRVRAIDGAGNVEPWNQFTTETTFYAWQISGRATDARGNPLTGATAHASEAARAERPSSGDRPYRTYLANKPSAVDVSWSRAPYAPLPPTQFKTETDGALDVVLPSPDNVVANWGFEANLAGWTRQGNSLPVAWSGGHTGRTAARLGGDAPPGGGGLLPVFPAMSNPGFAAGADAAGRIYVAVRSTWAANGPLYLTTIEPNGAQSTEIVGSSVTGRPALRVAADGVIDLLWVAEGSNPGEYTLHHARRDVAGDWTAPYSLAVRGLYGEPALAVDGQDNVHVAAEAWTGTGHQIVYAQRNVSGVWSAPVPLGSSGNWLGSLSLVADASGRVHVLWGAAGTWQTPGQTHYRVREADGRWTDEVVVALSSEAAPTTALAVDGRSRVHALWRQGSETSGPLFHGVLSPAGAWDTQVLDQNARMGLALAADELGLVHAVWGRADGVAYARLNDETEGKPSFTVTPASFPRWMQIIARTGTAYAGWINGRGMDGGDAYLGVATEQGWGRGRYVGYTAYWRSYALAVLPSGQPAAAWYDGQARYFIPPATGFDADSRLSQTVSIPAELTGPTLSLMLAVEKPWPDARGRVEARVRDAAGKVTTLRTYANETPGWQHQWYDMTPWQGQTVTVELAAISEAGGPFVQAYADEITLGSGLHADTWAHLIAAGIPPGSAGRLTLLYGNRGSLDTPGVTLRLTLSSGVTLLQAEPPATADGGAFAWSLGDLAADTQGRIEITLRNDNPTPESPGVLRAEITPGPGELDTGDNQVSVALRGEARVSLPMIAR